MVISSNGKTKHAVILEHIHSAIMSGEYKVGKRIPSETQLARYFRMTRATVGKALRDLQRAGFLDRRPGSGSYARLPENSQSKLLALVVPSLGQGEIFEPICSAIATAVRAHDFTVLWGQSAVGEPADKARHTEELCRHYIAEKVDGVFFTPFELIPGMDEASRQLTDKFDRAGIPVVLLDSDILRHPQRSRHDVIGIDNRRVGRVLVEHLVEQGCRRIEFIYRPMSAGTIDARIAGYQEGLRQHGISPRDKWVRCGNVSELEFVRRMVSQSLPDAYLCANDYTAAELMQTLISLGVRVPEDVFVVGVDDVKYARLLSTPLTTIRQDCAALGAAAVNAMIRRIEAPNMPACDVTVDFRLIVRRSSERPPKEPANAVPRAKASRRRMKAKV